MPRIRWRTGSWQRRPKTHIQISLPLLRIFARVESATNRPAAIITCGAHARTGHLAPDNVGCARASTESARTQRTRSLARCSCRIHAFQSRPVKRLHMLMQQLRNTATPLKTRRARPHLRHVSSAATWRLPDLATRTGAIGVHSSLDVQTRTTGERALRKQHAGVHVKVRVAYIARTVCYRYIEMHHAVHDSLRVHNALHVRSPMPEYGDWFDCLFAAYSGMRISTNSSYTGTSVRTACRTCSCNSSHSRDTVAPRPASRTRPPAMA